MLHTYSISTAAGERSIDVHYWNAGTRTSILVVTAVVGLMPSAALAETPEAVADAYLKVRNAQLVSGRDNKPALPAGALAAGLQTREQHAQARLRDRRAQLAASGERYTRSTTTTRILQTAKSAQAVVLRVEEETRLYYAKANGSEPEYTSFVVPRDFFFVRDSRGWVLRDVRLVDAGGIAPVNEVVDSAGAASAIAAPPSATPSSTASPMGMGSVTGNEKGAAVSAAASYNYPAMANYATTYWKNYNGAYRRMTQDCTNFISQAMYAGGWAMKSGWYQSNSSWWYNSLNQSYPWGGAENWYWFATGQGRTYILSNVWSMGLADVLQLDFDRDNIIDHTMLVTVSGSQKYLTYHTTDTLNRSLSSIIASYPSAWYYAHRT